MLLDLLKTDAYADQIASSYLLFPTVERMAETPNGRFITILIYYLQWPIIVLLAILNLLPYFVKVGMGCWLF